MDFLSETPLILHYITGLIGNQWFNKWIDVNPTAIIAVEPNKDNLQELKNRLQSSSLNSKVHIVETSFENSIEDYNKITLLKQYLGKLLLIIKNFEQ